MRAYSATVLVGVLSLAPTGSTLVGARGGDVVPSFDAYVRQFGRHYASDADRDARRAIFEANVREVARLNEVSSNQLNHLGQRALFEINEFADQTPEEFQQQRRMSNTELTRNLAARRAAYGGGVWMRDNLSTLATPDHRDWFLKATTPVRDQGQCGKSEIFTDICVPAFPAFPS